MAKTKAKVSTGEMNSGDHLNEAELRQIEGAESRVTASRLEMALAEQVLANYNLQRQSLDLVIEQQKSLVASKARAYEISKSAYSTLAKEIFEAHGVVGDQVGYDSQTGKIINNEG